MVLISNTNDTVWNECYVILWYVCVSTPFAWLNFFLFAMIIFPQFSPVFTQQWLKGCTQIHFFSRADSVLLVIVTFVKENKVGRGVHSGKKDERVKLWGKTSSLQFMLHITCNTTTATAAVGPKAIFFCILHHFEVIANDYSFHHKWAPWRFGR